jgi:murein DD-endopeptidase MepM/ murein hydrolase activator NlpD
MVTTLLLGCSLLDRTPPSLQVDGPDPAVVADRATLRVEVDDASGADAFVVGGGSRFDVVDGVAVVDATELPEGEVELQVVAVDRSPWGHRAATSVTLRVDRRPPVLEAQLTGGARGRTAVAWVTADEPLVEPSLEVFERRYPLHHVDGGYRAFVGVGLRDALGEVPYTVTARDEAGNVGTVEQIAAVAEVDYPVKGRIRLTKAQKEARRDDEAREAMRQARDAAYALQRDEQMWSGPWVVPLEPNRKTSPFGAYRRYSDGERSYHTGTDLTWKEGSEVVSAAGGEVVLAELQPIHGNAVIVHHGQGVLSAYSHLDRIDVAVGDRVEAGQRLGIMGTTGQSTGPHLHFTVVVGGQAVDPWQWLAGEVETRR